MRLVVRILASFLVVPATILFLVIATGPATLSGVGYAAGLLLICIAGTLATKEGARRTAIAGLLLLGSVAGLRIGAAGAGRNLRMTAGSEADARWIDRLLDEEDIAVTAARALGWTRFLRDPDVPQLAGVMQSAYERMRASEGATPSPVAATYAGLEAPGRQDSIEIGDVVGAPAGVVVFLHGFAGSFTLPCWVVSRAAADAGFATVCPATRWVGDWWSADGEATLRETVLGLRRRGVGRIVLAGLSNGGIGASLLAPRFPGVFDSLIVISGASNEAAPPGIPVLAVQGTRDSQVPPGVVRAYADLVGGRYLSLDAGHFALLISEDRVRDGIARFLRERAHASAGRAETAQRAP